MVSASEVSIFLFYTSPCHPLSRGRCEIGMLVVSVVKGSFVVAILTNPSLHAA